MKKKRIRENKNPDADRYIIVHTKEGDHIRAKRTNPFINAQFAEMAAETCSAAAKQILLKLKPFTERMTGRMNVRLSGKIRSAKKMTGFYNYSLLNHNLTMFFLWIYNIYFKLSIFILIIIGFN